MRNSTPFSYTLSCYMTMFERSFVFVKVEIENSERCFCSAIAGMAEWWCACWWRTDEMKRASVQAVRSG